MNSVWGQEYTEFFVSGLYLGPVIGFRDHVTVMHGVSGRRGEL